MDNEEYVQRVIRTMNTYQIDVLNKFSYSQKALSKSTLQQKEILLRSGFGNFFMNFFPLTFFWYRILKYLWHPWFNILGDYLDSLLNCVDGNYEVLQDVLKSVAKQTGAEIPEILIDKAETQEAKNKRTFSVDAQKLNDCFVQIVREWTQNGEKERAECFEPVLNELLSHFPDEENRGDISVLVPGCGLARLPFEIAKEGFNTVGNERDFFQLFLGSFIMNEISRKDDYR